MVFFPFAILPRFPPWGAPLPPAAYFPLPVAHDWSIYGQPVCFPFCILSLYWRGYIISTIYRKWKIIRLPRRRWFVACWSLYLLMKVRLRQMWSVRARRDHGVPVRVPSSRHWFRRRRDYADWRVRVDATCWGFFWWLEFLRRRLRRKNFVSMIINLLTKFRSALRYKRWSRKTDSFATNPQLRPDTYRGQGGGPRLNSYWQLVCWTLIESAYGRPRTYCIAFTARPALAGSLANPFTRCRILSSIAGISDRNRIRSLSFESR